MCSIDLQPVLKKKKIKRFFYFLKREKERVSMGGVENGEGGKRNSSRLLAEGGA